MCLSVFIYASVFTLSVVRKQPATVFLISTHLLTVRVLQHFYAGLICAGTLEHFVSHYCAVIAQFTRCLFFLYFNNIAVIRQAVYSIVYYTNNVCSRFRWHNGTPNIVSYATNALRFLSCQNNINYKSHEPRAPGSLDSLPRFKWKVRVCVEEKGDLAEIIASRSADMLRLPFRLVKWHISPPRFLQQWATWAQLSPSVLFLSDAVAMWCFWSFL